jgi:hypothetical protein
VEPGVQQQPRVAVCWTFLLLGRWLCGDEVPGVDIERGRWIGLSRKPQFGYGRFSSESE